MKENINRLKRLRIVLLCEKGEYCDHCNQITVDDKLTKNEQRILLDIYQQCNTALETQTENYGTEEAKGGYIDAINDVKNYISEVLATGDTF